MATEISGGGIYWKSGIDNSDFKKGEQEIVSGFQRIEKAAQKSGDVLDKSISSKLGANAAQNIAILERELAKYEKTLERLSGSTNLGGKGFEGLKSQIRALYSEIDRQQSVLSKGGGISSTVIGETEKVVTATKKSASGITNVAGKAFGFLRTLANLIPGLGLAGLIGAIATAVVEAAKKLSIFNKELTELEKTQKDIKTVNDAAIEGYVQQKVQMESLTDRVKKGGKSFKEKEDILKTYNKEFGDSIGKAGSYSQAEEYIIKRGPAFIESLRARANEMAAMGLAIEAAKASIKISEQAPEEFLSSLDKIDLKVAKVSKNWFSTQFGFKWIGKKAGKVIEDYEIRGKIAQHKAEQAEDEKQKRMLAIYDKYRQIREQKEGGRTFNYCDGEKFKKAKAQTDKLIASQERYNALQKEISDSATKFTFSDGLGSEEEKVNKFFDNLKAKIEKFNSDPKNKTKLLFDDIESNRSKALSDADYNQETKDLLNELEVRKKEYQDYEEFKKKVGEDVANKQYAELITKHKTYLERLQSEEDVLANKEGGLSSLENQRYKQIQDERLAAQAQQKADESKHLAYLLAKYATYEQQKKALKEQYEKEITKLPPGQQAERKREYDEDLAALRRTNSEKLVALSGYTQEALYMTKLAAKHQLEIFNRALAKKDLPPDVRNALEQKANKIQEIINKPNRTFATTQIDKEINKTQKALDAVVASGDTTSEVFKQLNDDLMRLKQQRADIEITKLSSALGVIAKLAPALQDLANALTESGDSGTWGEVASGIATVAAGASQLNQTFSDLKVNGASTGDAIVAGLQFALNLITAIVSASKRRKAAEEEFYLNAIGLSNDYNLALTEQIRLQAELGENVYLKDYFGRAKSGMEAAIAAASKYQKALNDLSKGRAKERQKNVVDGKTVGQLALSGAGAGAAIGTAIGGWAFGIGTVVGAVIGAAVGAIGGLFAKKKKDVYGGLLEQYPELLRKGADGQREINKELAEALIKNNQLDAATQKLVQNALEQEKAYKAAYDQMRGVVADLSGSLGDDLRNALVNAWKAGEDSAKAFGDTVDKVLENILSNLIFHAAFNDLFDKLEKDLTNDFVYGGVGDITDTLGEFFKTAEGIIPIFNASMDEMNKMAKEFGLNAFGKTIKLDDKTKSKNSLSGAYAQASQESIDLLSGQTMAFKVAQLQSNVHLKNIEDIAFRNLDYAMQTATNTGATVIELKTAVAELKGINGKMNNNANNALAAGL